MVTGSFYRRGAAKGDVAGVRPHLVGDVQGLGRHRRAASGSRGSWRAIWRSGPARAHAGLAMVAAVWCARQLFDAWSASRATASAGRMRGQEQGGRVGEVLGDTCELQDMVFH